MMKTNEELVQLPMVNSVQGLIQAPHRCAMMGYSRIIKHYFQRGWYVRK